MFRLRMTQEGIGTIPMYVSEEYRQGINSKLRIDRFPHLHSVKKNNLLLAITLSYDIFRSQWVIHSFSQDANRVIHRLINNN